MKRPEVREEARRQEGAEEGPVLHSIDRDYAAFYGNPHLSIHLLAED